jgi:hypothetical protein
VGYVTTLLDEAIEKKRKEREELKPGLEKK